MDGGTETPETLQVGTVPVNADESPPPVPIAPPPSWPVLDPAALVGLAGDIVRVVDPYTEADPVAVLVQVLTGFGNMVGPGPHFCVEFTQHPPRLFGVLVGDTSKGRKGQSWSTPKRLLSTVDELWKGRITSGLSSGEGLISAVRDPRKDDPGEADKRLFVVEGEFAQALKVMAREGNILSPTIRDAWDHGDLHPLTKTDPIKATGAHISIIGHITQNELLRHLTATEQANGFANRFLWFLVRRTKLIPSPVGIPAQLLVPLVERLKDAASAGKQRLEIRRDAEAEDHWIKVYPALSDGKPGLLGAVIGRSEAQVMRVALVYALLDQAPAIQARHLKAALAVWDYAENSVKVIFGTRLGDPTADTILGALRERGAMSESQIRDVFQRNKPGHEIDRALEVLNKLGMATSELERTGGHPRLVWRHTH
jgi:Protein of unknown function (DUF3987)